MQIRNVLITLQASVCSSPKPVRVINNNEDTCSPSYLCIFYSFRISIGLHYSLQESVFKINYFGANLLTLFQAWRFTLVNIFF